jgi:hypothetical protein
MDEHKFEMKCGVLIAVFAAIMALTDMFAGRYGEDEIKFINEKSSAYMWYQSKSIRSTVTEGQRDLVNTLMEENQKKDGSADKLKEHVEKLSKKIERYEKEKKEILLGSSKVGQENWVQDIDGKLGQVIGAQEYEVKNNILGEAGDKFDVSSLFLQLCLVMGAISLVIKKEKLQNIFFYVMVSLGLLGTAFSVMALRIAVSA